jgi:hypothetical protein
MTNKYSAFYPGREGEGYKSIEVGARGSSSVIKINVGQGSIPGK